MFGDIIQPTHLIFILVVALLVLGPKRLPEVGRSLGRGIRDFRQGMQGVEAEARSVFSDALDEPAKPAADAAGVAETYAAAAPPLQPAASKNGEAVPTSTPGASTPTVVAADVAPLVAAEPAGTTQEPAATVAVAEPDPAEYAD
jgi:sec-independent protein translocase protein TatA